MKKVLITLVILCVLGAGGYGAYTYYNMKYNPDESQRVSSDSSDAVYVDTVANITGYGSGNGLAERFGGEIEPQATLSVKLDGDKKVSKCYVKEGEEVEVGQRLFVYDTKEDEDSKAKLEIENEKTEGDIELAKETIEQYEKDKKSASSEDQSSYTSMILEQQAEIKSMEFTIKSNELEISNLKEKIDNATVTAEMAGIVQKISDPDSSDGFSSGSDSAYITILAVGDYRVKGTVNEQNLSLLSVEEPMLVYSRVDNNLKWNGVISEIKTDKKADDEENNNSFFYDDAASGSSSYTFYVDLENSDGLILGQHVYMELDMGQDQQKEGMWLNEYYLVQNEDQPYVWLANTSNVIEKRYLTLGDYDEEQQEYQILDGLTPEDYIAFPLDTVHEGCPVVYTEYSSEENMDFPEGDFGEFEDGAEMLNFDDYGQEEEYDDTFEGFDDEEFGDEEFGDEEFGDEEFDDEEFFDEEIAPEGLEEEQ